MYCNVIIYLITFLHLFCRLLICTFVFGWAKGTGYRCGCGDCYREGYMDVVGVGLLDTIKLLHAVYLVYISGELGVALFTLF